MSEPTEVLARLRGKGHRQVRATHDATFELSADDDITNRATCVIGVSTKVVAGSPLAIAGPIEVILEVGDRRSVIAAVANPWLKSSDGGLVVRRSSTRLDDTLATDASTAAAGLDRGLIEALRDPAATLDVTIRRMDRRADGRAQLILGRVRAQGSKGGRKAAVLAAELAGADLVMADDAGAARWARSAVEIAEAAVVLRDGGRVLLLGTDELVGRCTDDLLGTLVDPQLEAFGMPASIAAAGFVGGDGPVTLLPALGSKADVDAALALADAGVRIVTQASASRARRLLESAAGTPLRAVLVFDPDTPTEHVARVVGDDMGAAVPERTRHPVIVAMGGSSTSDTKALPTGLLSALVDRGVPPSTIAAALASQPGWSRNHAYETVNGLR